MSGGLPAVPFFSAPADNPPRGRLLLIAPAFPPNFTVGALRWQRLAPYLAEAGWGLDVITLPPSSGATFDPSHLDELPAGTRVYGIREPVLAIQRVENLVWRLWRRLRPARSMGVVGAVPRERIYQMARTDGPWQAMRRAYFAGTEYALWWSWAREASKLAMRIISDDQHRGIITSGPPHMAHEAGRQVARRARLPFVMDLRDPWSLRQTLSEWEASPLWYRLARLFESRAVREAALIVANTHLVCTRMRAAYPEAPGRFVTVMNGSDPEVLPAVERSSRFTIAFAGTIYLDRDPRPLFAAAASVVRHLGLTPREFGIEMIGEVFEYCGVPMEELAAQAGLQGYVTLGPKRPRSEALSFMAGATMLVSLPLDSELTIPAKIFEFVQFDAWLLVMAPGGSATSVLLRDSGADVVEPGDVDGIAAIIRRRYAEFRDGVRPRALGDTQRFSRARQADVLTGALASVARPARDPSGLRVRA